MYWCAELYGSLLLKHESTQVPVDKCMGKENIVHAYSGILFRNMKKAGFQKQTEKRSELWLPGAGIG